MGYNIVNSGIFYYMLSDSDFFQKKHLMVLDACKYFSNEHRKDEYFDSIENVIYNGENLYFWYYNNILIDRGVDSLDISVMEVKNE